MAVRRHIFAVQNTTADALQSALNGLGVSEIHEDGVWHWVSASVWAVGAKALLDAVSHLTGPSLLVTTEDGCRWLLFVQKERMPLFSTYHEFGGAVIDTDAVKRAEDWEDLHEDLLGGTMEEWGAHPPLPDRKLEPLPFEDPFFGEYMDENYEDDEEEFEQSSLDELVEDYDFRGMALPESILNTLKNVDEEHLTPRFYQLHGKYIVDMLESYGIPCERQSMMDTLTGVSVSPGELESDWGNVARFLVHLGLRGDIENLFNELKAIPSYSELVYDPTEKIEAAIAKIPVVPIKNPGTTIPLVQVPLLYRIGYSLNTQCELALRIACPDIATYIHGDAVPKYVHIRQESTHCFVGFSDWDTLLAPKARTRVGALLNSLPEGCALDLLFSGDIQPVNICGHVLDGVWCMDSCSAPLDGAEISPMTTLFEQAESHRIVLQDAAERDDVIEKAGCHIELYDNMPQEDELALLPDSRKSANALCALLYRMRHGGPWDTGPLEEKLREDFNRWREVANSFDVVDPLPITDELLYEGKHSKYWVPDYASSLVDEVMKAALKKQTILEQEAAARGYTPLGGLVCEKAGPAILLGFASDEQHSFGVYYVAPYMEPWFEFYSAFEDETSLTTTTGMSEGSLQQLRILVRESKYESIADLHTEHCEGLKRLADRGIKIAPIF